MLHTFLLQSGHWLLNGNWLDKTHDEIPVTGGTIINWSNPNWFTMTTKLIFPDQALPEMIFEYKGHLPSPKKRYSYVLKHSNLGNIEGEGWLGTDSIVQCYSVLGDSLRRSGFETLTYLDENTYHLSSAILTGNHLISTMEAILERSL